MASTEFFLLSLIRILLCQKNDFKFLWNYRCFWNIYYVHKINEVKSKIYTWCKSYWNQTHSMNEMIKSLYVRVKWWNILFFFLFETFSITALNSNRFAKRVWNMIGIQWYKRWKHRTMLHSFKVFTSIYFGLQFTIFALFNDESVSLYSFIQLFCNFVRFFSSSEWITLQFAQKTFSKYHNYSIWELSTAGHFYVAYLFPLASIALSSPARTWCKLRQLRENNDVWNIKALTCSMCVLHTVYCSWSVFVSHLV